MDTRALGDSVSGCGNGCGENAFEAMVCGNGVRYGGKFGGGGNVRCSGCDKGPFVSDVTADDTAAAEGNDERCAKLEWLRSVRV